ncbi:MAG: hypothetical protein A2Z17_01630 [Gammaproteobacteria bacterium RBG_16_66_13]|nr:MAG: hypothetical protein A2Z17_01630 [Gammaproteobacteria bacterium RBG_16_66_13]
MGRWRWFRALTFLVAASLACNLGGEATQPPAPGATAAGAGGTAGTPTPTDMPPGEWLELEPPPPAGLIDAMYGKVEAGEWTLEEGLVQSLRAFAGEASLSSAYGVLPAAQDGTGLIVEAQGYLERGSDEDVKREIERLLSIIAPSSEALLPYAQPGDTSLHAGPRLAHPARDEQECATLWAKGFPAPQAGQAPVLCFKYLAKKVGNSTIRVFYPITELPSGFTIAYSDAAFSAAQAAVQTYSGLQVNGKPAILKDVDIIFTLLQHPDGDALAIVPFKGTPDKCQIIVYPLAISSNKEAQTKSGNDNYFGPFVSTIAHELFHCFQKWNFQKQWDTHSYDLHNWWLEGTAEYFANVVYPKINDEWGWIDDWQYNSGNNSVVFMSYENFALFQFLGTKLGNNKLLSLLGGLPEGGSEDGHKAYLSGYTNMASLFEAFAIAFMDGKIADTGGGFLPTTPVYILPEYRIPVAVSPKWNLGASPFVLQRYGLRFDHGHIYGLTTQLSGADGFDASRPVSAPGSWNPLPAEVPAACGDVHHYYLMVTTNPPSGFFANDLTVTIPQGELACDQCLIGTWDLNVPSFVEYSEAPFAETPGLYNHDSAGGLWRYRFRPSGTFRAEFDFFTSSTLRQPGGGFGADIDVNQVITIVGPGEGTYISDGLNNLTFTLVEDSVSLSSTTTINGEDIGDLFDALSGYGFLKKNDSMVYSCDPEAGILQLDVAPQAGLPPLQFDRISTDPNKP